MDRNYHYDRKLMVNPNKEYKPSATQTPEQWRKLCADMAIGGTLSTVRDKSFAKYCWRNEYIVYQSENWA